jgi:hypothetical protein
VTSTRLQKVKKMTCEPNLSRQSSNMIQTKYWACEPNLSRKMSNMIQRNIEFLDNWWEN